MFYSIFKNIGVLQTSELKKKTLYNVIIRLKKLIKDENNNIKKVLIYPKKSKTMNLAFDVTPAKYVTGLITEKGVCDASKEGLKKLFK